MRAAEQFKESRLPKFLTHFQSVLEANPANKGGKGTNLCSESIIHAADIGKGPFLFSNVTTAADLALFFTITGVKHAFPRRVKNIQESGLRVPPPFFFALSFNFRSTGKYDLVFKLCDRIQNEPKITEYRKSNRYQPLSNHGLFRHYLELDDEE